MKRVSDTPGRPRRPFIAAMTSWRTASVALLSFASGLPLGLVWIAIPDWMRSIDVDIRVVGLITLAQAPWSFKMLWSPLMDRYTPSFLGRRRGWTLIAQIALMAGGLALAGVGSHPDAPWIVGALALAIAFAAAPAERGEVTCRTSRSPGHSLLQSKPCGMVWRKLPLSTHLFAVHLRSD